MSMKQYIDFKRARSAKAVDLINPSPEAVHFPCKCCGGKGFIKEHVQFLRLDGKSIDGRDGPLAVMDIRPCPACDTTGCDYGELGSNALKAIRQEHAQEQGVA